jgi:hypothetical protein
MALPFSTGMPPKHLTKDDLSDDICPTCQVQLLTKPKPSSGYHNPENANRMYQQVCSIIISPMENLDENLQVTVA